MQPFACLPNHITGKGMIKKIKDSYPVSNIVPIDFDAGIIEVNQINRIKLMLTSAFRNMNVKKSVIDIKITEQEMAENKQRHGKLRSIQEQGNA